VETPSGHTDLEMQLSRLGPIFMLVWRAQFMGYYFANHLFCEQIFC